MKLCRRAYNKKVSLRADSFLSQFNTVFLARPKTRHAALSPRPSVLALKTWAIGFFDTFHESQFGFGKF